MELALQVVGMKLTGKIHDARQIALKIVENGNDGPFSNPPLQRTSEDAIMAEEFPQDDPQLEEWNPSPEVPLKPRLAPLLNPIPVAAFKPASSWWDLNLSSPPTPTSTLCKTAQVPIVGVATQTPIRLH